MSIQIAVRLPDELVHFLDEEVRAGHTPSRAALVSSALEREFRRQRALNDVALLGEHGPDQELDALVDWSARHPSLELD